MSWQEYFKNTKNYQPRKLLVQAASYVCDKSVALDLGSGALNETKHLLALGFKKVIAVDREPIAASVAVMLPSEHFQYVICKIEKYQFTNDEYDLVNAQYTLPFIAPIAFENVLDNIYISMKNNAIFTGQFFGDRDEWNTVDSNMSFTDIFEAKKLLSRFEIIFFEEEESDKETASGAMKHWHVFNFIVRKNKLHHHR